MPNAEASKILFFQQIVSESVRMFSLNRYQQSRCRCDDERLLEMCFDNFKHIKEHDIYYIIRSLSSEKLIQLYWHIRKKNICGTLDKFHGYCEDVFVYSYGHITCNLFSTFKPQLNRRLSVFEELIEILEPISKIDFKWLLLGNWTVIQTDK